MTKSATIMVVLAVGILHASAMSFDISPDSAEAARDRIGAIMAEGEALVSVRTAQSIDSANALFESAHNLAVENYGGLDTAVASALAWMAVCQFWQTDYDSVISLEQEAIRIWHETLGPEHPEQVRSLRLLADALWAKGKYAESIRQVRATIDLLKQAGAGANHYGIELAKNLNMLGLSLFELGDYHAAESAFVQSNDEWRARDVDDGIWYDALQMNLGKLYLEMGKTAEARNKLEQGLRILERDLGTDNFHVGEVLTYLGRLHLRSERYAEALSCIQRALSIREAGFGREHRAVIDPLQVMADLYLAQGQYEDARETCLRISQIPTGFYDHRNLVRLATVEHLLGNEDAALESFARWDSVSYRFLKNVLSYASSDQKLRYSKAFQPINDRFVSFAASGDHADAPAAALAMLLRRKGIVLDALWAERQVAYCSADKGLTEILNRHTEVCGLISSLSLAAMDAFEIVVPDDSLQNLYAMKDQLEVELSYRCTDLQREFSRGSVSLSDVAAALNENEVLWEIVDYAPFDFQESNPSNLSSYRRYLLFSLDHSANVEMVDLGPAIEIDSLVASCRRHLSGSIMEVLTGDELLEEQNLSSITRVLYDRILAPLEQSLSQVDHVYICPDGQLNLLPFDILTMPDGRYLIERFSISYLSAGRDLVAQRSADQQTSGHAALFADPEYDQAPIVASAFVTTERSFYQGLPTRGVDRSYNCLADRFVPLPATSREGTVVAQLLAAHGGYVINSYSHSLASEDVLKDMQESPSILHLATHGYYCQSPTTSDGAGFTENPLLRSGLALAGANGVTARSGSTTSWSTRHEDGILTSLEVSGLRLVGTDLVVLSACQTGVGDVVTGEGVFGLRRAFQHAGARSIVMSMFAVPDRSTVTLMERFYENWLSGEPKSSALRDASLSILRERRETNGAAHPLFWGGFILVGDPN